MPNRMIRDSARTSATLEVLSHGAERFFWRLVLAADDFGRFDAEPSLLLASCFPRKVGRLRPRQILGWRSELIIAGLIKLYEIEGRSYGYFVTWERHQRVRNRYSKFPDPPGSGKTSQPVAADGSDTPQPASGDEGEKRETKDEDERRNSDGKPANKEFFECHTKRNKTQEFSRQEKSGQKFPQRKTTERGKLAQVLEK